MKSIAPYFFRITTAILFVSLAKPFPSHAQNANPIPPLVEKSQVESRLKQIEENTSLDAEIKATTLETLQKALEQISINASWRTKIEELNVQLAEAPANIESLQAQLGNPLSSYITEIDISTQTLDESTQLSGQLEQQLTVTRDELSRLESESSQRKERRRLMPDLQNAAFVRLQEAKSARDNNPLSDASELAEAQQWFNSVKVQSIENELAFYNLETQGFDLRSKLRNLRMDVATRHIAQLEKDLKKLQDEIASKRRIHAKQAAIDARKALLEAGNAPPQIRTLAEELATEISALADERLSSEGILNKIEMTNSAIKKTESESSEIANEFAKARHRVDVAERSSIVGTMLRTQKAKLPSEYDYRRKLHQYEAELTDTQFKILEYEEQRRALNDLEGNINDILLESAPNVNEEQKKSLTKLLKDLFESKRSTIETYLDDLDLYSEKLVEVQSEIQQLITATTEFRTYINERILWAKSGSMIHHSDITHIIATTIWLVSLDNLDGLRIALVKDSQANALLYAFTAFSILLLITQFRRMNRYFSDEAEQAQKGSCVSLKPTVKVLILTPVYPLAIPAIFMFIGWRLNATLDTTEYVRSVGMGLFTVGLFWWIIGTICTILAPTGIGPSHFDWAKQPSLHIAKLLWRVMPILLVLLFFIMVVQSQQNIEWQETFGRIFYVAHTSVLLFIANRLLKQRGGPIFDLIDMRRGKGHLTMRRYWHFIVVFGILALIALALAGYFYSALQVTLAIEETLVAILLAIIMAELIMRWAMLARRKGAIAQRKMRLSESGSAIQHDDDKATLALADKQTARMVWISCVFLVLGLVGIIWNDMFPAIRFLDEIKISEYTTEVTYETPNPEVEGEMLLETSNVRQEVTLRHLVIALVYALLTLLAMRNLPGFLEIAILQNTSLGTGERYAIRTLVSYVILFVGIIFTFNNIGLQWSQLQWLVAALSVGLGFGLQEIFANFVSGLVILFERPIRVGDTVTVGTTSGVVSKIRIRATHIIAFNRQELIVPNKDFVTNQLINWNLTDQILRVEVPVGIAYGSDTDTARKLIMEVANNNPLVLTNPKPEVFFVSFGDNTLNFELRVFSPSVEHLFVIRDQMHTGIDKAFREAGIGIAFPQRDLHIRSIESTILEQFARMQKED